MYLILYICLPKNLNSALQRDVHAQQDALALALEAARRRHLIGLQVLRTLEELLQLGCL